MFSGGLGGSFSDFCCLGDRLENCVLLRVTLGILNGTIIRSMVRIVLWIRTEQLFIISWQIPGHNLSLGLRAETEDSGLSTEPRSSVAPSQGGPADSY